MKNLLKNLTKLVVVATFMFVGVSAMAANFDFDPAGSNSNTNFASINECFGGCGSRIDSLSMDIPNPGDTQEFNVFLDFRNESSGTIYNAAGSISYPTGVRTGSSAQFTGSLTGSVSGITDYSTKPTITNLPAKWEIEFVSSRVKISTRSACIQAYPSQDFALDTGWQTGGSPSNISIPRNLRYEYGNGWCDQGFAVAKFRITNKTTPVVNLNIDTLNPTGVDVHSATLNGEVVSGSNVDTWFALSTSSNPSCTSSSQIVSVSGLYNSGQDFDKTVTGLSANTHYYYRACGDQGGTTDLGVVKDFVTDSSTPNLNINTNNPTNINTNAAILHGEVVSGSSVDTWFALSTSSNPSCGSQSQTVNVSGYYNSGESFSALKTGLTPNTHYYYRACGDQNGTTDHGSVRDFTTDAITVNLDVRTDNPTSVDDDGAVLNGHLVSGNNATVWFAFSTNPHPDCTNQNQTQYVSGLFSSGESFWRSKSGLTPNTHYYYRACADQNGTTNSGTERDFITDGDAINVNTYNVGAHDTDSAVLRGELTEGDYVKTWFVIDDYANSLNCHDSSQVFHTEYGQNAPHTMDFEKTGLTPHTHYHYKACAEKYSTVTGLAVTDEGSVKSFWTENNVNPNSLDITTRSVGSYNTNSATFRGKLESGNNVTLWFVYGTNNSEVGANDSCNATYLNRVDVSGTHDAAYNMSEEVTGLTPNTHYYYRACGESGSESAHGNVYDFTTDAVVVPSELSVSTLGADVHSQGALLNGRITGGETTVSYFVYGNENVSCTSPSYGGQHYVASYQNNGSTQHAGDIFTADTITTLSPGTYYFVACAEKEFGSSVSGSVHQFTIGNNQTDNEPSAVTKNPGNVSHSSADIKGTVDMNDYDDGFVFFVYGRDYDQIGDVTHENEYSSIHNDGQNLRKVSVESHLHGEDSYSEHVSNLTTNKVYYYRICVEFKDANGDYDINCGSIKHFKTGDSNGNHEVEIKTLMPDAISSTSASICGNLISDGGDSGLRTFLEYRKYSFDNPTATKWVNRGTGRYCETIRNLDKNTKYAYRACADTGDCGDTMYFVTTSGYNDGQKPEVTTGDVPAYSITSHSALLPGTYITHADKAKVWFQYGRSENLNKTTRVYTKYGSGGEYSHNFTGLKSNQRYCYRAVIRTINGTDYGATKCFTTLINYNPGPNPGPKPKPKPIEVVVPDDKPDIDLSRLGLGLSLIRLDIDDNVQTVTRGQNVTYTITWENISELDLRDLELNVEIPREVRITASSRGKLDQDKNSIFYTIDRLDAGEENSMTINGIVENGNLGDALTANATIAFDNPINRAQENAQDYDVDDYVIQTALGTASVFGLGHITLLGWLTILLGLFIVFLVARWLYLEREELRAQAYVNGYGQRPYAMAPIDTRYEYLPAPRHAQPVRYVEPIVHAPAQHAQPVQYTQPVQTTHQQPMQSVQQQPAPSVKKTVTEQTERADYRPYRPNRG